MKYALGLPMVLALAACGGLSHPLSGHSATPAVTDRMALHCNDFCGMIENLDTGKGIDVTYKEGVVMNEYISTVSLDPGRYRIGIMTNPKYTPWDQTGYASLELIGEPGGVYTVGRDYDPGWFGGCDCWHLWIEGAGGKVVAERTVADLR